MDKTLLSGFGLVIAFVLFVAVNVLFGATFKTARADLTENDVYTLSPGTINILEELDEPITLRLYFSRGLAGEFPDLERYAGRVEDLLSEYERRSDGQITLRVLDPEPFSEIEERAIQYGLRGAPTPSGEYLYFGLVGTNSVDDEEVIPFLEMNKERTLEYDLTQLVYKLATPERGVVGVMSTLPLEGGAPDMARMQMPQPWLIMDQLRRFLEVQNVPTTAAEIPAEVDVLMLVHPRELSEDTLFAIDQFVLRGGHAMVFFDPHCEAQVVPPDPQNPMMARFAPRASDLGPLLAAWGVAIDTTKFAADSASAQGVTFQDQGRVDAMEYLAWLNLPAQRFNADDVVTGQLGNIVMHTAGAIEPVDGATTTLTPLIQTSPESMRMNVSEVQFGGNPRQLLDKFLPTQDELVLAARLNGPARTAFPERAGGAAAEDAEGDDAQDEEPAAGALTESRGPINVVLVADADLLVDDWWARVQDILGTRLLSLTADNASFVVNSLEHLSGSNDLISLRGRQGVDRPFTKVQEIQRRAAEQFRTQEQALLDELQRTEQRIAELQRDKEGADQLILSPEQQAELEKFRERQVQTKRSLREVRYSLRKDIDRLGAWLKFLNIWLIPLLILATAIGLRYARRPTP